MQKLIFLKNYIKKLKRILFTYIIRIFSYFFLFCIFSKIQISQVNYGFNYKELGEQNSLNQKSDVYCVYHTTNGNTIGNPGIHSKKACVSTKRISVSSTLLYLFFLPSLRGRIMDDR